MSDMCIDPEFQALTPPLTQEERDQLEANQASDDQGQRHRDQQGLFHGGVLPGTGLQEALDAKREAVA